MLHSKYLIGCNNKEIREDKEIIGSAMLICCFSDVVAIWYVDGLPLQNS